MKSHLKSLAGRYPALTLIALAMILMTTMASTCGGETEKANQLVDEVNSISAAVEPKFTEVEVLLTQASSQLTAGQVEAEKASLTRALQLIDEIIPEVRKAKQKTDEAAGLQISDSYRQYLEAKARSLDASLKLTENTRELTNLFLADLTLENPETLTRVAALEKMIDEQIKLLNEAEDEASKIAAEHSDEIKE